MSDPQQPAPRSLDVVQRWMQAVITHPAGIVAGVESSEARSEIDLADSSLEAVITRSQALTSVERLAVYGNAFYARLLECMRELFPALTQALSEEVFDSFAFGYLQQYPSRSYTLERLADHFVQFLEETRPALADAEELDSGDSSEVETFDLSWPDFVIDLARFEWTIDRVFDGPGVENQPLLSIEQLQAIPPEQWAEARLTPAPCLHLLALKFPVNDYYTAYRGGEEPALPEPGACFVAITRRDYIVRRHELSQPQFELLSMLVSGQTIGDAIADCASNFDDPEQLAESLQNWFRNWSLLGFFQSIRVEPS